MTIMIDPAMIAHRRPTHWLKEGANGTARTAPREYDALMIPRSGGETEKAFETGSLYPLPKSSEMSTTSLLCIGSSLTCIKGRDKL